MALLHCIDDHSISCHGRGIIGCGSAVEKVAGEAAVAPIKQEQQEKHGDQQLVRDTIGLLQQLAEKWSMALVEHK